MTTAEEARDRLDRRAEAMETERSEWRSRAWAAEAELGRIERELLNAIGDDRELHPDGADAQPRLGLLAALRIVQGDRFGAPKTAAALQRADEIAAERAAGASA